MESVDFQFKTPPGLSMFDTCGEKKLIDGNDRICLKGQWNSPLGCDDAGAVGYESKKCSS